MSKTSERAARATDALVALGDVFAYEAIERDDRGRPVVHFIVRSVAASGMSRVFSVHAVDRNNGRPRLVHLDRLLADALGYTETRDGFRVGGCGMDMRFAVCDSIARRCSIAGVIDGNDFDYRTL